ncbi:MAG: AAA family ATPase [Myxococcota bacterium]
MAAASIEAASQEGDARDQAPTAHAERRRLTVLFCDLVESTQLASGLDAEDYRDVVRAYHATCSRVIGRYEGHVAQYLGDGILVYFGHPRAHEDDAERAVRAGLEMLSALGDDSTARPRARVGIHTGPVVVGEVGDGARRETLALGDTTNLAARLQGIATPGSVVVSGATLRLAPGLFITEDLGTPELKGVPDAIRAYRVLQVSGVRGRREPASGMTPVVGRHQELGILSDRWERIREGEGQAVLVSGEAGLGKSRLVEEFRLQLSETPHSWLECRCSSYMQNSALFPLIELLKQGLGYREEDGPEEKLERLEQGVRVSGLTPAEVVPLLAPLLSVPLPDRYAAPGLDSQQRRARTLEALVAWILALGERQPVLMLCEDLQWSDPSTVELLGLLLEQLPTAPVLTVLTFRPDFAPPWRARSHVTSVLLNRLTRRHARDMLAAITPGPSLPEQVVDRIVARADGVPMFIEELSKMVLESGLLAERGGTYELTGELEDSAVPATLHDSLMARLDRLSAAKEVAQVAAVLGRDFTYELLSEVAPLQEAALRQGLERLVDAELLFQRGSPPTSSYSFKHALVQDAAYQSLLKSRRRELHRGIATALEQRSRRGQEVPPELLAHHFDEAGLAQQAVAFYRAAGERAEERSANAEAAAHLERGLHLLETLPETDERAREELTLLLALGVALQATRGFGAPEVGRVYSRARALCDALGEERQLFPALWGQWAFFDQESGSAEANRQASELLDLARRAREPGLILQAHHAHWTTAFMYGDLSSAKEHVERGLEIYRPTDHHVQTLQYGNHDPGVCARFHNAWALWLLGYADQARDESSRAVELSQELDHPHSIAWSLRTRMFVEQCRRDVAGAEQSAAALIQLASVQGFSVPLAFGRCVAGWARASAGEVDDGIKALHEGLASLQERGAKFWQYALALLAECYGQAGRAADGLRVLADEEPRLRTLGAHFYEAELQRIRGELMGLAGEREAPEAAFRQAGETARRQGARALELRAATSLSRLLAGAGRADEARDALAPAYGWFSEGLDTADLREATELLAALS